MRTSSDLIVNITGLKKYFGDKKAVDGIDLKIPRGSIFGFLGPNGAGKTTTISCLITLLNPTAGEGTVAGVDLYDRDAIKSKIGAVFQEQAIDEVLTARQNLKLHAELHFLPKKVADERIAMLAEMVGLTERMDEPVMNFSGGMRRRLEIARGLLTEPEILFLDEPTIGLDPQSRANIQSKIKEMNRSKGITIFITTHDMGEAESLCDYIYIIDQGKIITQGTSEELKASLGNDFVIVELEDEKLVEKSKEAVSGLEIAKEVRTVGRQLHIGTSEGSHAVSTILSALSSQGITNSQVVSVEIKKPTLNDVFLYYTGRELRDDHADLEDRLKMIGRKRGSTRRRMVRRR